MRNNWAFLIWIGICFLLGALIQTEEFVTVLGKKERRVTVWWALLVIAPVIIGAASRGVMEGDTGTYQSMFRGVPTMLSELRGFLESYSRDKGYAFWEFLFKAIVGNNFQAFLAVNATFCGIIVALVYRKFSCVYLLSIFLFVAGFDYYQWMFNGMRQFMAVSIMLACTEAMIRRDYKKIILPLAIAATLHMSVLIVVPSLFVVHGKAFNRRIWLFLGGAILTALLLAKAGMLNDLIATLMQSTQYESVLDEFLDTMDSGTNALRVAVYAVPTLIAFVCRRQIKMIDDPIANFCVNMSVISTGIYLISMFTSAIMIGRLPIYFSIYNYILLPWEIKNLFTKRSANLIVAFVVFFYLLYNFFQVSIVYQQPFTLGFFAI